RVLPPPWAGCFCRWWWQAPGSRHIFRPVKGSALPSSRRRGARKVRRRPPGPFPPRRFSPPLGPRARNSLRPPGYAPAWRSPPPPSPSWRWRRSASWCPVRQEPARPSDRSCFLQFVQKFGHAFNLDAATALGRLGDFQHLQARGGVDAIIGGALFLDGLFL